MFKPARRGGAAKTIRITTRICVPLLTIFFLGACVTDSRSAAQFAPRPPVYGQIPAQQQFVFTEAAALNRISPALGAETLPQKTVLAARQRQGVRAALAADCSVRDRFDRDLTLSYRSSDGRTQMGLNIKAEVGLGAAEFKGVMLAFRYKLQEPGKRERATCLYDSPVQGLIGSVYNELVERDRNTVWNELEDYGLDF